MDDLSKKEKLNTNSGKKTKTVAASDKKAKTVAASDKKTKTASASDKKAKTGAASSKKVKTDNASDKKTALKTKEIEKILYTLAYKAENWLLTGGESAEKDGIEVYRTQIEDKFIIKDVETGILLGMLKEIQNDGVVTRVSFFYVSEDDLIFKSEKE